jgi:hypothetical protein
VKRNMNLAIAILKEFDIEGALKDEFDVSNRGVWYQLNLLADANLVRHTRRGWALGGNCVLACTASKNTMTSAVRGRP